jgi:hypothetical protein
MKALKWKGIVVAVVIAAAMIFIRPFFERIDSTPASQTESVLLIVGNSIDDWRDEHKRAPSTEEGVSLLSFNKSALSDGWGQPLIYRNMGGEKSDYLLYSAGPNGRDENGGGDDIRRVNLAAE